MGMFDSAYAKVKCPVCNKEKETEIQFKTYLGRYSPFCKQVRIGESIKGFPKIPRYEEEGLVCFNCACWDERFEGNDCILIFIKGVFSKVIFPIPDDYKYISLPTGKNSQREHLAREEEQKRYSKECEGKSLSEILLEPFRQGRDYDAIGRRIFNEGPYSNYLKRNGRWERNPYAAY